MARQPDEHITFPAPPEAVTGLGRRVARTLCDGLAFCGGALLVVGVAAVLPREPIDTSAFETTHCFPTPEETVRMAAEIRKPEFRERLLLIGELLAREAEIRARLPRAQPGVIIPNEEQETFR